VYSNGDGKTGIKRKLNYSEGHLQSLENVHGIDSRQILNLKSLNLKSLNRKIRSGSFSGSSVRFKVGSWRSLDTEFSKDSGFLSKDSVNNLGEFIEMNNPANDQPFGYERNYDRQMDSYDFYNNKESRNDPMYSRPDKNQYGEYGKFDQLTSGRNDKIIEWVDEPHPQLSFSNNTGGSLSCSVRGPPPPHQVMWNYADGRRLHEVNPFRAA